MGFIRGDRIIELREAQGLNQKQLADQLEISANQVSKYELGKGEPSIEVLMKLKRKLNTTADYLLGDANVPQKHPFDELPELEYEVLRRIHGRDEAFLQKLIAVLDIL